MVRACGDECVTMAARGGHAHLELEIAVGAPEAGAVEMPSADILSIRYTCRLAWCRRSRSRSSHWWVQSETELGRPEGTCIFGVAPAEARGWCVRVCEGVKW